jgi:hypothetical protein
MERIKMGETSIMMMAMERMICEMKCTKMMMDYMMYMDGKMDIALMNKIQECDEVMNSTMSMVKLIKEKHC